MGLCCVTGKGVMYVEGGGKGKRRIIVMVGAIYFKGGWAI